MEEKIDLDAHYRPFMEVVTKSPFEGIEKHAKMCYETVKAMEKMFNLYLDEKFDEARGLWQTVQDKEHEADKLKNTLRDKMPRSLFMPIKRDAISHLLHLQDRLADTAEDVADMMASRDTKIPKELKDGFRKHMENVMKAVEFFMRGLDDVDRLLDGHFRKKDVKATQDKLHHVSDHEWYADLVKRDLRRKIFSLEGKESDIAIYHMLKLLRRIDDVANNAETAEGALRMVIAR